jgi:hypothetical protein
MKTVQSEAEAEKALPSVTEVKQPGLKINGLRKVLRLGSHAFLRDPKRSEAARTERRRQNHLWQNYSARSTSSGRAGAGATQRRFATIIDRRYTKGGIFSGYFRLFRL